MRVARTSSDGIVAKTKNVWLKKCLIELNQISDEKNTSWKIPVKVTKILFKLTRSLVNLDRVLIGSTIRTSSSLIVHSRPEIWLIQPNISSREGKRSPSRTRTFFRGCRPARIHPRTWNSPYPGGARVRMRAAVGHEQFYMPARNSISTSNRVTG